jgi:hypothetical protein
MLIHLPQNIVAKAKEVVKVGKELVVLIICATGVKRRVILVPTVQLKLSKRP